MVNWSTGQSHLPVCMYVCMYVATNTQGQAGTQTWSGFGDEFQFCTMDYAKEKSRNILLQTLTDDRQIKPCAIQCLEVEDWNKDTYIPIQEVPVQSIPIDKEDIPKKSDVEKMALSTRDRFPWNRCTSRHSHWEQCTKGNGITSGYQQPEWWAICM